MKCTLLICVVVLCLVANIQAATTRHDGPHIHSEALLQKHLDSMTPHDSPLLYLSDAGLEEFVEEIKWTDSGIAGFSFFPLELELTEYQAYRVLDLFGLAAFITSLNTLPDRFDQTPPNSEFLADLYALRTLIRALDAGDEDSHTTARYLETHYIDLLHRHAGSIENFGERELHQLRTVLSAGFTTRLAELYAGYYETSLYASSGTPPQYQLQQLLHYFWVARDFDRLLSLASRFNLTELVGDHYLVQRNNKPQAADNQLTTMTWREGALTTASRKDLFKQDLELVVVSSPGCGFSRALYRDFEQGVQSHPDLPIHFSWFISQQSSATPAELFSYAEIYPSIDFEIVFFDEEWEEYLDLSQYPLIYVVAEGEFSLAITGWSAHNKISDLVELVNPERAD